MQAGNSKFYTSVCLLSDINKNNNENSKNEDNL